MLYLNYFMAKKKKVILNYILLIVLVAIISFALIFFIKYLTTIGTKASTNEFKSILIGSTDTESVSIELKPLGFLNGKLEVSININTHSVDLTKFNLKEIISLEYNGKIINPIEVPVLQGHHVSGKLVFNMEETKSFTIKIKGIPDIEERVFSW